MVGFIVSHRHDSRHVCRPRCLQRRGGYLFYVTGALFLTANP